jgi:hypothetical protein
MEVNFNQQDIIQIKTTLCYELELLIYSYFDLTEVLIFFDDNHEIRDLVLARNDYYWPTWDEVLIENYYDIAKYFLESGKFPNDLNYAIQTGNMKMLELLTSFNVKFHLRELCYCAYEGDYDIFIYLVNLGIRPDNEVLNYAKEGYRQASEYNEETDGETDGEIISTEGFERIINYFEN